MRPAIGYFAALLFFTGCYSTSIAQTPSTVPPGKLRFATGFAAMGTALGDGGLLHELSLRFGVLDFLDLGVKTTLVSFEGQVKAQLVRGDLDLSLAASGMLGRDDDDDQLFDESPRSFDGMRSGRAMVIAGHGLSESFDLVLMADGQLGERGGYTEEEAPLTWRARFVGVGGGLGVLFRGLGSIQFMPELVFTHFWADRAPTGKAFRPNDDRLQLTVTAFFGGRDDRDRASGPD